MENYYEKVEIAYYSRFDECVLKPASTERGIHGSNITRFNVEESAGSE